MPSIKLGSFLGVDVAFSKLGDGSEMPYYMKIALLGVRDGAGGAILYAALYVDEVAAAACAERKEGAVAKHTVKVFALDLMAGKILTFIVFKILA